jgi:murein L,D-transpeptidase YafK
MFHTDYHPAGFSFPIENRVIRFCYLIVLLSLLPGARTASAGQTGAWILVDIGNNSLSVMQGDTVKRSYSNISIGRGGSTPEKNRDDGKTPLGEFHIVRISTNTPFRRFFALDYPDLERASQARRTGTIDQARYAAIRHAIQTRRPPPQDTVLGGHIGIHGLGKADAGIHEDFNWTYGCIALTNAQIDELSKWVDIGTKVVIRHQELPPMKP